ncbi:MAG: rod shape-determining protein RodA [Candidatus Moranbacteria bacterium]|nr:rod shape-determining protein RodA [bacterium]MDP1884599.1 rod shape-determining protein RodA [Candidatus Moranbacteria bacterium]MDZ4385584.1 rod shape-determining protein RodA [Candidatus Moranbacteria bacterium]
MKNFLKLDWILTITVSSLLAVGLMTLYSISSTEISTQLNYFEKQLTSVAIGLFLMLFFSAYDYRVFITYSTKFYFLTIIILSLLVIWGTTIRGTTGWIGFGSFNIQPVEMTKVVMIIFLASFLSKKKTHLSVVVRTVASIVLVFVPVMLILKQPDFGSAAVIIGIWAGMLFVSGLNKRILISLVLVGVMMSSTGWFILKDYQKERLMNFVSPERDPRGSGYNVIQSIVAVGSGGIWGKGLGHGSQSQLNFLPEKHTDFIFAVFAEELGFAGAAMILGLFGVLIYRIKETARLARDNFGYLLAVGIGTMLFLQILVNVGMNIGVAPVAGVPLPLLSYGGSSMISVLASLGIIQSIYARRIKSS